MGVHAEEVAEAVGEEGDGGARLEDFVNGVVGFEDAELLEALDEDFVGEEVGDFPVEVGAEDADGFVLHAEDDLVDGEGFGGEGAADGVAACDVGGVVAEFGTGVDEDDVLVEEGLVVVDVVEGCGGFTSGKDTVVGLFGGAELDALTGENTLALLFVVEVLDVLHEGFVGDCANLVGVTDESDFVFILDCSELLEDWLEGVEVKVDVSVLFHKDTVGESLDETSVGDLTVDGEDWESSLFGDSLNEGFNVDCRLYLVNVVDLESLFG